jgi:hypothetical protein
MAPFLLITILGFDETEISSHFVAYFAVIPTRVEKIKEGPE